MPPSTPPPPPDSDRPAADPFSSTRERLAAELAALEAMRAFPPTAPETKTPGEAPASPPAESGDPPDEDPSPDAP